MRRPRFGHLAFQALVGIHQLSSRWPEIYASLSHALSKRLTKFGSLSAGLGVYEFGSCPHSFGAAASAPPPGSPAGSLLAIRSIGTVLSLLTSGLEFTTPRTRILTSGTEFLPPGPRTSTPAFEFPTHGLKFPAAGLHSVYDFVEVGDSLLRWQFKVFFSSTCHHLVHSLTRGEPAPVSVQVSKFLRSKIFSNLLRLLIAEIRNLRPATSQTISAAATPRTVMEATMIDFLLTITSYCLLTSPM
jgi:hypothetical protein